MAPDKFLYPLTAFRVRNLFGWVLHGISRDRSQWPPDLPLPGQFTATDGINGYPGAVGRIFHRKPQFQLQGNSRESSALDPQETNLVILLPGNIIARADVDAALVQGRV